MQIKSLKSKYVVEFVDFSGNSKIPIANATNLAALLKKHLTIIQYGQTLFKVNLTGQEVFTTHRFDNVESFLAYPQGKIKLRLLDLCCTYEIGKSFKFLPIINYRKFLIEVLPTNDSCLSSDRLIKTETEHLNG